MKPPFVELESDILNPLLDLKENWDGYGASPIKLDCLCVASQILTAMSGKPKAVPVASGGVQLEWYNQGCHLEILVEPGQEPEIYIDWDES